MSTLQVATIKSNSANTVPVIRDSVGTEVGQFCRAWVNFNGTGTVAIRASFNVSSITDNGTGNYSLNFTVPMPDANYAVVGTTLAATISSLPVRITASAAALTTTSATVRSCSGNQDEINSVGNSVDSSGVFVSIFR